MIQFWTGLGAYSQRARINGVMRLANLTVYSEAWAISFRPCLCLDYQESSAFYGVEANTVSSFHIFEDPGKDV